MFAPGQSYCASTLSYADSLEDNKEDLLLLETAGGHGSLPPLLWRTRDSPLLFPPASIPPGAPVPPP